MNARLRAPVLPAFSLSLCHLTCWAGGLTLTLAIHAAWWESNKQYDCRGPVNSNLLSILLTYLLLVPLLCPAQIVYHNLEVWLFPGMAQLLPVLTSSTSSFHDALFRQTKMVMQREHYSVELTYQ